MGHWRRRRLGWVAAVSVAVACCLLQGCGSGTQALTKGPPSTIPPSSPPSTETVSAPEDTIDQQMAWIEQMIRWHYGAYLSGVRLKDDAVKTSDGWMFEGEYTLKDLPLRLPFRIDIDADKVDRESVSAEGERTLIHEELGGVDRFYALAKQYHHDFPNQPSLYYWLASDCYVDQEEPYRTLLRGHRGPTVVVYDQSGYWDNSPSTQLALYSWEERSKSWVLIHRGYLPDRR
jgi:hypothetical protein